MKPKLVDDKTDGIAVSDELREEFEDLATDDMTLRAKFANFSQAIQAEQRALLVRSKEIWAEVLFTMKLEGKWRYENGKVYPVDETTTK